MADIRWALRLLRRHPAFSATIVLTLAGAIAAVATSFGIATAVLWRPLPFADSDRLVFLWENTADSGGVEPARVTTYRFEEWQRSASSFSSMARFGAIGFLADRSGAAQIVNGVQVSTNYFDTLAVRPVLGRAFLPSDAEPGARRVVVLSHALWTQWFGGRADVIGTDIRLAKRPYTVIGVMPPVVFPAWPVNPAGVTLEPDSRRLWVPIVRTAAPATGRAHVSGVVARLKPGVSIESAAAEMARLSTAAAAPDTHGGIVRPFRDQFVGPSRLALLALVGAAFAVLLVACANIAALQGSATEGRRAELGVRAALGASGMRLARQFAVEAAILAGAGALLGLAMARVALVRVPELLPPSVPLLTAPAFDTRMLLLMAAVALAAAAMLAAWPLARIRANRSVAPRGTVSLGRSTVFRTLVVAQIALAVALAAPAALLQQSLNAVRNQDAGFAIDRVLVGNLTLTSVANGTEADVIANQERLAAELVHLPGARGVAFAYDHPLAANWTDVFSISGTAAAKDDVQGTAQLRIVSPSYFETMDVAVLDGRALSARDDLNAPGAVVVNEAFVRSVADGHALNRILRSGTPRSNSRDPRVPVDFRIVGVVENERFRGLEQAAEPAVYMSTRQFPQSQIAMLIRTSGDPASIAREARDRIQRLDPGVAVEHVAPLATILAEQLVTRRGTTHVIDGFAAVTLGLAALGLYGLLALLVAGRRRETGIRLALGSSPKQEAARVLGECLGSTGLGVACGIGLALVSGRLVQSLLVGVSPRDTATLSTVAAALVIVGVAAASLPAWRAARVDPASVLRGDS